MKRSDFHFHLPPALIAQRPLPLRGASRLLCLDGPSGAVTDRHFAALPTLLRAGDLLVFNDTQVMRARLFGRKETGGRVEILVERLLAADEVLAQVRASKSPQAGGRLLLEAGAREGAETGTEAGMGTGTGASAGASAGATLECLGREGEFFRLRALEGDFPTLMERYGHIPLPPYIQRPDEETDLERYQTIYSRRPGAVAAPTAGLHFDADMLQRLADLGVASAHVTLHVGAGTFQPVRVENLDEHPMHAEWLEVNAAVCAQVAATRAHGGRVVAVGTTSVRSLETAAASGALAPFQGETRLFIRPGYRFQVVDALITNFHLPESTLLMLVSAFSGYEAVMAAYQHAVREGYRFFSYGDAMFLTRRDAGPKVPDNPESRR